MSGTVSIWPEVYRQAPLLFHAVHDPRGNGDARNQRVNGIGRVDCFSGGWAAVPDNPEMAEGVDFPAWLYYEVIAGRQRYWYVIFEVYHPIDDKGLPFGLGSHPQDLEWILQVYDRQQGMVVAAVTLFHDLWYWACREEAGVRPRWNSLTMRRLYIDEPTQRPTYHIQEGGHGIRPYDPKKPREPRIIYTPNTMIADMPVSIPWFTAGGIKPWKTVRYRLVRITQPGGLWDHRNDLNVFRTTSRQQRLAARVSGKVVATQATPVWSTGLPIELVRTRVAGEDRWLSPIVVNPNKILVQVFTGIAREAIIDNPFLI